MIFLGVGSSIGNAEKVFEDAEQYLKNAGVEVIKKSKIMRNPPYGGVARNEFSNAVWAVIFCGEAMALLNILKRCEAQAGRNLAKKKWDDRELDLDILMFNDEIFDNDDLKIPHPEIPKRIFVLQPWCEIVDKNFQIIKFGAIQTLLNNVKN